MKTLGILGGMGALCSAQFIKTLYSIQNAVVNNEQELCPVILYSNPGIPDRTKQFLSDDDNAPVLNALQNGLQRLIQLGAEQLVICCFTAHHLVDCFAEDIHAKLLNLPELLIDEIKERQERTLILCTKGTRQLRIFERTANWSKVNKYVVFPDILDVDKIHQLIYHMKQYGANKDTCSIVSDFRKKYKAKLWAGGCTEFHLVAANLYFDPQNVAPYSKQNYIDPLFSIGFKLADQLALLATSRQ